MIYRIRVKGGVCERSGSRWVKSKKKFPEIKKIIRLFKESKNFDVLIGKDRKFLKGQLANGKVQGGRVAVLPSGEVLDKAFSLFAKGLVLHDQDSHDHWDVLYENPGGTFSYCYTRKKRAEHRKQKYSKVRQFSKVYPKLVKKVGVALRDDKDDYALPMYTLLKTYMRVGNESYYKAHGHKGLATIMKSDVRIRKDQVTFQYIGKDGVPLLLVHKFPKTYVNRLRKLLRSKKRDEFVFGYMGSKQFKKAFECYCGKEFYPHIVRSYYATKRVEDFLKGKRKLSKEEVDGLFMSIAHELGHRKFNKKKSEWEDNFKVTINHYVQPELVERVLNKVR